MRKNNTSLSLTVILFIVIPIFNLVYASSSESEKHSKTNDNVPKDDLPQKDEDFKETKESGSVEREEAVVDIEGDATANINGGSKNKSTHMSGKLASGMLDGYMGMTSAEDMNNDYDYTKKKMNEFDNDEANTDETTTVKKSDIRRSLKAGDIFTPYELLPVTERLLKKVDLPPGTGRSIVSASKNPEDLADKIFASYFLTMKRIVILKAEDIVGLDALQALAIEGDPEDYKYMVRTMSKYPKIMIRRPDKEIESHLPPKRSRYKLITKKETKHRKAAEVKHANLQRRQLLKKLQQKMPKNRHIIVNPNGKHKNRRPSRKSLRRALMQPGCSWHYECRNPRELESCHLKAKCDNVTLSKAQEGTVTHGPEEDEPVPDSFRRAVGISVIDEEVHKIIAKHTYFLRPENFNSQNHQLESVEQYFNMLMARHAGSTPPLGRNKRTSTPWNSNKSNTKKKISLEKLHSYIPFGVPFRKNSGWTSTTNPFPDKSIRTTPDQSHKVTPQIVKLIGKG